MLRDCQTSTSHAGGARGLVVGVHLFWMGGWSLLPPLLTSPQSWWLLGGEVGAGLLQVAQVGVTMEETGQLGSHHQGRHP